MLKKFEEDVRLYDGKQSKGYRKHNEEYSDADEALNGFVFYKKSYTDMVFERLTIKYNLISHKQVCSYETLSKIWFDVYEEK